MLDYIPSDPQIQIVKISPEKEKALRNFLRYFWRKYRRLTAPIMTSVTWNCSLKLFERGVLKIEEIWRKKYSLFIPNTRIFLTSVMNM